jgi:hypothetical protein
MGGESAPWRCGVCRKELRGVWAMLTGRPFPVCTRCRLMVHHGCLGQTEPPICRRCAEAQSQAPPG